MADLTSNNVRKAGSWDGAFDHCVMTYDERMLRRKVIQTAHGTALLVDLPSVVSLDHGDAFELTDGRVIEVIAADEDLLEIKGTLPRLAWHIGNRHKPCQLEPGRLLIQRDHVLKDMLKVLGADLREVFEPFTPEGGAYGHGRTMGHSHGPEDAHDHSHGHSHEHGHDHAHSHGSHSHMNGHAHGNGASHSKMNEHRAPNGRAK